MPVYMNCTRKNVQVIRGSVTEKNHVGWIELQSVQFGTIQPSTGRGGADGEGERPHRSEIVVSKLYDSASPLLLREATDGGPMQITLHFVRANDENEAAVYLSITLQDVLIASYSFGPSAHQGRPTESISLNFTKATYDRHGVGRDVSARVKADMAALEPWGG